MRECVFKFTVKILIDRGANVNAVKRRDKLTALHYAVVNGLSDIVAILLSKNADVNAKGRYVYDPAEEPPYVTPLLIAVEDKVNNAENISRLLLAHGADVNIRDYQNKTFLQRASFTPHNSAALVNLLIDHGADVNAVSNISLTALDYALMGHNLHIMRLLIDRGANLSLAYRKFSY